MTTPDERTRALRWAGEFLREVRSNDSLDQTLRSQAHVILRHYPNAQEIKSEASISASSPFGPWLAPEREAPAAGEASEEEGDGGGSKSKPGGQG
jgi:hypothetical protein